MPRKRHHHPTHQPNPEEGLLEEVLLVEEAVLRTEEHILERLDELAHPRPNHIVITQGDHIMATQQPLIGGTPGSTIKLTLLAVDTNGVTGAFPLAPTITSDNANVTASVGPVNADGSYPVTAVIAPSATVGEVCNLTAVAGSITSGAVNFPTDAAPFVAVSIVITQS